MRGGGAPGRPVRVTAPRHDGAGRQVADGLEQLAAEAGAARGHDHRMAQSQAARPARREIDRQRWGLAGRAWPAARSVIAGAPRSSSAEAEGGSFATDPQRPVAAVDDATQADAKGAAWRHGAAPPGARRARRATVGRCSPTTAAAPARGAPRPGVHRDRQRTVQAFPAAARALPRSTGPPTPRSGARGR